MNNKNESKKKFDYYVLLSKIKTKLKKKSSFFSFQLLQKTIITLVRRAYIYNKNCTM